MAGTGGAGRRGRAGGSPVAAGGPSGSAGGSAAAGGSAKAPCRLRLGRRRARIGGRGVAPEVVPAAVPVVAVVELLVVGELAAGQPAEQVRSSRSGVSMSSRTAYPDRSSNTGTATQTVSPPASGMAAR